MFYGFFQNWLSLLLGSRQISCCSSLHVLSEVFIRKQQDADFTLLPQQDFQFRGIKSCLHRCLRPSYQRGNCLLTSLRPQSRTKEFARFSCNAWNCSALDLKSIQTEAAAKDGSSFVNNAGRLAARVRFFNLMQVRLSPLTFLNCGFPRKLVQQ